MPTNNIIEFKIKRKSEVFFYRVDTEDGKGRFGVHYRFGDDISDSQLNEANTVCDTIAYREHYKAHIGKYPDDDTKVSFGMPGRVHDVSFMDIPSVDVYKVAELIANYLKVSCMTPITNPVIMST